MSLLQNFTTRNNNEREAGNFEYSRNTWRDDRRLISWLRVLCKCTGGSLEEGTGDKTFRARRYLLLIGTFPMDSKGGSSGNSSFFFEYIGGNLFRSMPRIGQPRE